MDQSTLSKILNGKRQLGPRAVETVCRKLNLDEVTTAQLTNKSDDGVKVEGSQLDDYRALELDVFEVVSDWHHFAILELMTVENFAPNEKWVSKTLGLTLQETKEAIARLIRVRMLEIDEAGNWVDISGGKTTTMSPAHTTVAFRHLQKQILEKAIDALDHTPIAERDQTSVTMAIDNSKLPEARILITKFRRSLAKFLARGDTRNDVYNLTIALYPLTKFDRSSK